MKLSKTIKMTLCASLIATSYGCSTTTTNDQHQVSNSKLNKDCKDLSYIKEGFLNDKTFRVIVIEDLKDSHSTFNEVRVKAKRRALIVLRKFLLSKNRQVDSNTSAKLMGLIENFGELKIIQKNCNKTTLYTYDIKKNRIKHYLATISEKR